MTLSRKLDVLQSMAIIHLGEPYKLYLIQLLAEHAEDKDMTADFLTWVKNLLSLN